MSRCVFVWDAEGIPPEGDWTVVLWRGFSESSFQSAVSIPKLVEDKADILKARYLAWIYDLGEKRIGGKKLLDHLELRPGFSYWWMTAIAQKLTLSGSPQVTDAIRLMAFDSWATDCMINRVVLHSSNQALAKCIRLWCTDLGVGFEWRRKPKRSPNFSLVKRAYQASPHMLKAIVKFILYFVDHWPLRGIGLKEWQQTEGQVTFFTYLLNLEPKSTNEGRFESLYWDILPAELQKNYCKTNWLHIYIEDPLHPTTRIAALKIDQFNRTATGEQVHVTLNTFLSVRIGIKVLCDWFRLIRVGMGLESKISVVTSNGLNLWPLYAKEWHDSIIGTSSIINSLYLNLFEAATKSLPKQQVGIY